MSRDIRSFFTVLPKNGNKGPLKRKNPAKQVIQISDNEDIIPETPPQKEKKVSSKKRKIQVISSDSEEEKGADKAKTNKQKKKNDSPKKKLKPVNNLEEAFGSAPVKQKKIEKVKPAETTGTELDVHNDSAFEKTLLDLDDELFEQNADILDKTIEEALSKNNETSKTNNITTPKTPKRKRKNSENEDNAVDNDQERHEKKRHSAILYQKYLNRGGPKHHGSKEVPKGKPNCLENITFLRTGVLDSLEGSEFEAAVKDHGGRVVHAVSKKVNYVVVGDEPGPAKLEKAKAYGIPNITEDEFLDMIRIKSGMAPVYVKNDVQENGKVEKKTEVKIETHKKAKVEKSPLKLDFTDKHSVKQKKSLTKAESSSSSNNSNKEITSRNVNNVKPTSTSKEKKKLKVSKDLPQIERNICKPPEANISWTEKYKPKDLKGIIGQQGEKSNMNKLLNWLRNWHKYHGGKDKPKVTRPSPWAKDDNGAYYKCALLSGPPGVGKTTTATLVAQEFGFDIVEFNASDTRSKKLLKEEVAQLLSSTSLANYATKGTAVSKKHVLLMDEVDGMAGNEDRGGIQELIALIKNTHVPIICMCNDRNHPKIRSLVNYCYDLRFSKPRLEQIKGAMMSICFKEGVKIPPDALTQIISATGMDVRQTLNNISMWTVSTHKLETEEAEKNANNAKKDTVLGPWEVVRQVFSAEDHKNMSLADKVRLFFYDYSIGPLFVQENYLKVVPHAPKGEFLLRASKAADAISMSDIIDAKIRGSNNWSLLETQGFFASVFPGHYMEGHIGGQINFPAWLGKNSKRAKYHRLLNELQSHARLSISGGRQAMCLDYLPYLRDKIFNPLIKDGLNGVENSLETMKSYNFLREDMDGIVELTRWSGQNDIMSSIDSKVKAAFTRTYNKTAPALPFAVHTVSKKKSSSDALYGEEEENDESDVEEDDSIEKDTLIKLKKPTASKKNSSKAQKEASTSRSRAKKAK